MRTASRSVLRFVPYCAASSRSPGKRSLGLSTPFKIWLRRSRKIVAAMLVEGGARCSMACGQPRPTSERHRPDASLQQDRDAGREVRVAEAQQEADRITDQEPAAHRERARLPYCRCRCPRKSRCSAIAIVDVVVATVLQHEARLAEYADLGQQEEVPLHDDRDRTKCLRVNVAP